MENKTIEEQREIYKDFIRQFLEDIDDIQDLKRIYTIVYLKYEKTFA